MLRLYIFIIYVIAVAYASGGIAPLVKLRDGNEMPQLGLGTWLGIAKGGQRVKPAGDEVEKSVQWAIDAGYRHIDTAYIYNTEEQVGRALAKKIADGTVKREDLFITTKLWNDKHRREDVVPALRTSLKMLNLDYIDLYLIHWPIAQYLNGTYYESDYTETWAGMIEAQALNLTKSIGLSNFNEKQIDRIIESSNVVPAVLQVEQPELLKYCKAKNIKVTGYTPFGSLFPSKATHQSPQPRVDNPTLVAIADRHNKTVPQINLKYLVQLDVIPIPKSLTQNRIEQNINIFDIHLNDDEMRTMSGFDQAYRTLPQYKWLDNKYYPFERQNGTQ